MDYHWAVIGAGPAGIAAVGMLLDQGISPHHIAWIDPHFTVGDFGTVWRNVPSNTKVKLFLKFLLACPSFQYAACPHNFALHHADPEQGCQLNLMVEPLQWVTQQLQQSVRAIVGKVEALQHHHRAWEIKLNQQVICAKNVILAIGSEPKTLALPRVQIVSLEDAMDSQRLRQKINGQDSVAVFGASHSAILVLKNLVKNKAKQIINFYRTPLKYAVYLNDEILFDDSGLKGQAAQWARDNIDGQLPSNLKRVYSTDENIEYHLPQCNKAVYAVGFSRRTLPHVEGFPHFNPIDLYGILAPGLFGFGIAFPEVKLNSNGAREYRVGLWKFMEYLQRVMPIWLKYPA